MDKVFGLSEVGFISARSAERRRSATVADSNFERHSHQFIEAKRGRICLCIVSRMKPAIINIHRDVSYISDFVLAN